MGPVDGMVWVHRSAFELSGIFFSLPFGLWLCSLLFFLFCVCHPYSLRSLRSCVCSPVCALSLSLYSFFSVSILPLFCFLSRVLFAQFIARSERVLGHFPLTPTSFPPSPCRCRALLLPSTSIPDRRVTAYCTYVFSPEV